ncbi:chromogranin-A [Hippoglossus stenolepis]|uniref:chromogranin-A n=1 Tax=Hippoglossus stenolepis TaxID=195615 RepID=UPI001FAFF3B8|nr:chromogranin-A [Hippoglossus stenolepis]
MIGRGLFILTALSTCVLSLPVTSSQLENEDVKVMKCVVEALADVLSRPHPIPVSQECLVILKTDDRLVTILRHHNFLKELQEIAVQGDQERAQPQTDAASPLDPPTPTPQATDASDRSMLEALGGPGERSILSQKKRTGNRDGDKGESPRDGGSLEEGDIIDEVQVKREDDESPGSQISEAADDRSEGKAEKREEEEVEEGSEEKRGNSEEENMTMDEKGAASAEKRDRHKSKEQTLDEKDKEEKDKRSSHLAHKHKEEQEEDVKRGSRENLKRWSKRGKGLQLKKKAHEEEAEEGDSQQEVPHHSKEVPEDEEGEKKKKKRGGQKSPEEKELQMIAKRAPEEKGLEEEGSASRKSEEPEIESLAAIESELENVAQKLHELRRG